MINILISLTLVGGLTVEYGRIGVKLSPNGIVSHVYDISPAANAGIQVGDVILSADGVRGDSKVDGISNQEVTIVLKHKEEIKEITLIRVPPKDIADIDELK